MKFELQLKFEHREIKETFLEFLVEIIETGAFNSNLFDKPDDFLSSIVRMPSRSGNIPSFFFMAQLCPSFPCQHTPCEATQLVSLRHFFCLPDRFKHFILCSLGLLLVSGFPPLKQQFHYHPFIKSYKTLPQQNLKLDISRSLLPGPHYLAP